MWSASPIAGSGATDTRTVLINSFEKLYPNIHVTLVSAPTNTDTNRATLATEISGGAATPDVFMGDVIWPAQFGAHQLAVPLSDYLPASYFAQFAPGLVAGASYKGKVYGSPLFEDQGFMYYRKDLLAKAGLAPPTTWEQLESEAKTLLSKHLVKYGFVWQGASYEGLTCNFMEYLASAGGTATKSDYSTATLDSPAAIKAVTFMRSLVTSGVTPAVDHHVPGVAGDEHLRAPATPRSCGTGTMPTPTPPLRPPAPSRPARSAWSRCRRSPASRPPGTPTSAAGTCTSTRTARTSTST